MPRSWRRRIWNSCALPRPLLHLTGSDALGCLECRHAIRNDGVNTGRSGVSGKSRSARVLGRTLRMPSVLDRKGTRWMLQALSLAPVIVLVHRGRKSGRLYKTPVEILVGDPKRGELVV